jgi:4-hydroxybenzoate polyprenyltransferase
VLLLVIMSAAVGLAASGAGNRPAAVLPVAVAVTGFIVFAVAVNDLADEVVDRVNLPGAAGRPLVQGRADRRDMVTVAGVSAALALAAAPLVGRTGVVVVAAGLVFGAAYSLPPVRLSGRGALAPLLLPAGFVAVPFLVGLAAGGAPLAGRNAVLLAGLYIGFIGRILLKDFRDVRGDALFGKRTFLVRHGREATCRTSAVCWVLGAATLLAAPGMSAAVAAAEVTLLAVALVLLRRLRTDLGHRRDELLISAIAIVGRGMVLVVVAQLSALDARKPALFAAVLVAVLTALTLADVRSMLRYGPRTRLRLPADMLAAAPAWAPAPVSISAAAPGVPGAAVGGTPVGAASPTGAAVPPSVGAPPPPAPVSPEHATSSWTTATSTSTPAASR